MQAFATLMYHNVTDNGDRFAHLSPSVTDYFVDQETFRAQIRELTRCARCVDTECVEHFFGEDADPSRTAAAATNPTHSQASQRAVQITFDDGWKGSLDLAGPILDDAGCQGLLFVTSDLIGCPEFVTRSDLRTLDPRTLFVGSHARTHRLLDRLNDVELSEELRVSKQVLEDLVGYEVASLTVPGGALNNRVLELAGKTGYRFVYTSQVRHNTRRSGPLNIGRVAIKRTTTMHQFRRYLAHRLWRDQLRRQVLQISKSILGRAYRPFRGWLLGVNAGPADMVDLAAGSKPEDRLPMTDAADGRPLAAVYEDHADLPSEDKFRSS